MSEKGGVLESTSPEGSAISADRHDTLSVQGTGDEALDFLRQHGTEAHFAEDVSRMRRLRRRIDIRVIPFLALSYLVNFLDKSLLNVCIFQSNCSGVSLGTKLTRDNSIQMLWASQRI